MRYMLASLMICIGALTPVSSVTAAIICSMSPPSLCERVAKADRVCVAIDITDSNWNPLLESPIRSSGIPATVSINGRSYLILRFVRSGTESSTPRTTVPDKSPKQDLVLLTGATTKKGTDWDSPEKLSRQAIDFAINAPKADASTVARAKYFLQTLATATDKTVLDEIYKELRSLPIVTFQFAAAAIPTKRLRELLDTPTTPWNRIGLAALLLGVAGDPMDAQRMERWIDNKPEKFTGGLDELIAGYLLLQGPPGLTRCIEQFMDDPNATFPEKYALLMAVRFMNTSGDDRINRSELREVMRQYLEDPLLFDLVIPDLVRQGDWTLHERLKAIYDDIPEDSDFARMAVLRYMYASQEIPPEQRIDQPRRVALAKSFLQDVIRKQPKLIQKYQSFYPLLFNYCTLCNAQGEEDQSDASTQLRKRGATVFVKAGEVHEVSANRSQLEDDDLQLIASFPKLTDLSLEETKITDEGLAHLVGLRKLEWLNLYRTKVGDEGLRHLSMMNAIKLLPIGETKITDEGLAYASRMKQLTYLGLRDNKITDRGLRHLSGLLKLKGLYLGGTQISDEGIKHLQSLTKLEQLWLNDTSVSDASIAVLSKLKNLRELYLYETNITKEGIRQLRSELTLCNVIDRKPKP